MKIADVYVGMKVAVRTGGVTADDIRSGRQAVLGEVTHVGKYRLAKQGNCKDFEPVEADYPGASQVVVVRVPKQKAWWTKGSNSRPTLDDDGKLRETEYKIFESGQLYPIGIWEAGVADRRLIMLEREAYAERQNEIRRQLQSIVLSAIPDLMAEGYFKPPFIRFETYARQTGYIGEARVTIDTVPHANSKEHNPLWKWLMEREPKLTAEYRDLDVKLNECRL